MQSSSKNNIDLSSLKVGFILPAFNEYENIFILLKQIESFFNNISIIIIDDSTNDSIKNKISSRNDILYITGMKVYPEGHMPGPDSGWEPMWLIRGAKGRSSMGIDNARIALVPRHRAKTATEI